MITVIQGNIFESDERFYAHGCNTVGLMGKGFAKEIRERHPIAYQRYMNAIAAGVFNLGYAQFVLDQEADRGIYNLATQQAPGKNGSYYGIDLAFKNMLEHAHANGINRIAFPCIGAGIAGLNWDLIKENIDIVQIKSGRLHIELVNYQL